MTRVNTTLRARFGPGSQTLPLRLVLGGEPTGGFHTTGLQLDGGGGGLPQFSSSGSRSPGVGVQLFPAVEAEVFVTAGQLSGGRTVHDRVQAVAIFTGGDAASAEFAIDTLHHVRPLGTVYTGSGAVIQAGGAFRPRFAAASRGGGLDLDEPVSLGFNLPGTQAAVAEFGLYVENYVLRSREPIFGAFLLDYTTSYRQFTYHYSHQPTRDINFSGLAVALHESGAHATLAIDIPTAELARDNPLDLGGSIEDKTEIYRVVSEYVADPDGAWEKPPNFPNENTYPGMGPNGPDDETHQVLERVHEVGYVTRLGSIRDERFTVFWERPYQPLQTSYRPAYRLRYQINPPEGFERAFEFVDHRRMMARLAQRYPGLVE